MSNNINWGAVYCKTYWGDTNDTTDAIPHESSPTCWLEDVLEISVDSILYKTDTTDLTVDQTLI